MRQISYMQAGMEALKEELRRDPMAFHMATDAPPALVEEFGSTLETAGQGETKRAVLGVYTEAGGGPRSTRARIPKFPNVYR